MIFELFQLCRCQMVGMCNYLIAIHQAHWRGNWVSVVKRMLVCDTILHTTLTNTKWWLVCFGILTAHSALVNQSRVRVRVWVRVWVRVRVRDRVSIDPYRD